MPVLKHAKKKLRQDKVRTERNKKVKDTFKKLVKEAKAGKSVEALSKAFSSIDKAAKHHILPKNKAARMKSALTKFVASPVKETVAKVTTPAKKAVKEVKKTTKKVASKKK